MARKPRVWFPGATYHIISRGVRKHPLFYDEQDRKVYLNQLEKVMDRYPCKIHSYCLMTNHIHLLLETVSHSSSKIIKLLHTRYAIYYKFRHQVSGHVFESRYTGKLIDSLTYFLEASKYIHRNPLEANLIENSNNPLWSSLHYYKDNFTSPILTTNKILSYFPNPSLENYLLFVNKVNEEIKEN